MRRRPADVAGRPFRLRIAARLQASVRTGGRLRAASRQRLRAEGTAPNGKEGDMNGTDPDDLPAQGRLVRADLRSGDGPFPGTRHPPDVARGKRGAASESAGPRWPARRVANGLSAGPGWLCGRTPDRLRCGRKSRTTDAALTVSGHNRASGSGPGVSAAKFPGAREGSFGGGVMTLSGRVGMKCRPVKADGGAPAEMT